VCTPSTSNAPCVEGDDILRLSRLSTVSRDDGATDTVDDWYWLGRGHYDLSFGRRRSSVVPKKRAHYFPETGSSVSRHSSRRRPPHVHPSPPRRFDREVSPADGMSRFAKKVATPVTTCAYEEERLANIARNRERLQALGIVDASRGIADAAHAERLAEREKRANITTHAPKNGRAIAIARAKRLSTRVSTRRSSRLAGPSESNIQATNAFHEAEVDLPPLFNAETYTKEHANNLGTSVTPWTLFVDGYDDRGNRIYDTAMGKTCHQCRQKTACKHTECSVCAGDSVRGRFCGDCLCMRYGENVDEVLSKVGNGGEWRCPPCRDLCNCSFCRHRKGWPPTGSMYRRAIREGFESVAHYLVLGGNGDATTEANGESVPVSANAVAPSGDGKEKRIRREIADEARSRFVKKPRSTPPVSSKLRSVNEVHDAAAPATPRANRDARGKRTEAARTFKNL